MRRRGGRRRRGLVVLDVDDELEAHLAVVGHAAEEPPRPRPVELDGVVAGAPLLDRVAVPVALPERLPVHLRHRVSARVVREHCNNTQRAHNT